MGVCVCGLLVSVGNCPSLPRLCRGKKPPMVMVAVHGPPVLESSQNFPRQTGQFRAARAAMQQKLQCPSLIWSFGICLRCLLTRGYMSYEACWFLLTSDPQAKTHCCRSSI